MPADSYHTNDNRALGLRVGQILTTERIGVACIRCDKFKVYGWETFRHFRRDMPVAWLEDGMTPFCLARKEGGACGRWFVTPDDGCSDAG